VPPLGDRGLSRLKSGNCYKILPDKIKDTKRQMKIECNRCGACCIAPSISSEIPGMNGGKTAGVKCIHLTPEMNCGIYNSRPEVCKNFTPTAGLCGSAFDEAFTNLSHLEEITK